MANQLWQPPKGSCFLFDLDDSQRPRLCWYASRTWLRWFPAAFLAFWLCGWAAGEFTALSSVLNLGLVPGKNGGGDGGNWFLLIWLIPWTLGGCAAMYAFYLLVRPRRPEQLVFGAEGIYHDPGTPSLVMNRKGEDVWSFWFPPKPRVIPLEDIRGIRLDRVGERQRLTVDVCADRIEIGKPLREPEREWLTNVLRSWAGQNGDYQAEPFRAI